MSGSGPASSSSGSTKTGARFKWPTLRQAAVYAYAIVLPWLAALLSFHTPALRGMRLALNFASIAAVAAFFGVIPALVATIVSAIAFNFYYAPVPLAVPVSTPVDTLIRTGVVFLAGGLIALVIKKRHDAERSLRVAMEAMREQSDALIQAQQASVSAAWTFSVEKRRTRWYPGGAEIFGRPHDEITALGSPTSLVLEEDRPKIAAAAELTIRTGAPFRVEFRVLWPNGEIHWLEARGTPLESNVALWRGATIDITERKQAEAALIRSEKLAVAGRLAASIAHEINNPLEAVVNLCYLARRTAADAETRSYIAMAEDELSRVAHITSQTLRFHRQQSAAVETDLAETVRAILALYNHKLAHSSVSVEFDAQPVRPLLCYAGEMRQVLANLIANALDAMPNGGLLRLGLRAATDWRTGAEAVRITISDNGHGMSRETLKRIYEPFYTTKGDVGTGLGLWVTTGIIEKHKGTLRVRSSTSPNAHGTAFAMVIPYPKILPSSEPSEAELTAQGAAL